MQHNNPFGDDFSQEPDSSFGSTNFGFNTLSAMHDNSLDAEPLFKQKDQEDTLSDFDKNLWGSMPLSHPQVAMPQISNLEDHDTFSEPVIGRITPMASPYPKKIILK